MTALASRWVCARCGTYHASSSPCSTTAAREADR